MDRRADDVLAELEGLGALGVPQSLAPPVTEVVIEQGPPSAEIRDIRGPETVAAIDEALLGLDDAVNALERVKAALIRFREVWEPEETLPEPPETVLKVVKDSPTPAALPQPSEPSEGPTDLVPPALGHFASGDDYLRAREAAVRKIRGDDLPGDEGDDDNIPFVGQERAVPMGQEPDEVTIRTVGTIKPNFPTEEQDGT